MLTTTLGAFGSTTGSQTTTLDLVNGQAQAFLFGSGAAGIAQVRATFIASSGTFSGSASVEFRTPATFFISSVSPGTGSAQGGDTVTILGGGFDPPLRVLFGATPATVLSSNATQVRVTTPQTSVAAGSSLAVSVSVTINLNETAQQTDVLANGFIYTNGGGIGQPVLLSMSPAAGPNDGGTNVTIIGDGFEAPVQVLFGTGSAAAFSGVEATVRSVTRTRIELTTPQAFGFGIDNRDDLVAVLVRNLNSGATGLLNSAFQYGAQIAITSMAPTEGPRQGGTRVTIFGQGFDDPVAVEFGGRAQTPVSTAGSEIVAVSSALPVPLAACADPSGASRVVNIDTGAAATGPVFTYRIVRPSITGISPTSGSGNGGNSVVISGIGFEAPVRVLFGTLAASVTASSPSSVTALVPAFTGTFATRACTTGAGQTGEQFVPFPVSVTLVNLDTTCQSIFANGYSYNPPDTTCRVVTDPPVASFSVVTAGLTASFLDTSTGSPTSWSWDFGDATTSFVKNPPPHAYLLPGTYIVRLTVTNAGGSSTAQQAVTVAP